MKKLKKIELEEDVKHLLKLLQEYGEGYVVGGYVRDKLLDLEPHDCDFVTNLSYEKLLNIFKDYSPKEIGKAFGIIQIQYNGKTYEIAKYRKDIGIPEDRREQEIEFTNDIMEDLKRRDFTINAIAFDGEKYICSKESESDICYKILRFVGVPEQRIQEDPLRIMRFFRLYITKNKNTDLEYDNKSHIAIYKYAHLLKNISYERIRDEFNKILMSWNPEGIIDIMIKSKVFQQFIPEWEDIIGFEQQNKHHNLTVDEHILKALSCTTPDLILRLATLFHDIGKPKCFSIDENHQGHFYGHEKISADIAKKILTRMKYDNDTIERVYKLIKYHLFYKSEVDKAYVKKMINRLGEEDMYRFFKLVEADKIAHVGPYDFTSIDKMKILLHEIISNKEPLSLKDLAINGNDLKELGLSEGKQIGQILKQLLDRVIENPDINYRENLMYIADLIIHPEKIELARQKHEEEMKNI